MSGIVILGAGMAGYGAANKFKEAGFETDLFEKESYIGGHCASFIFDNKWIFDDGPHISFTKTRHIKDLFTKNTNNECYEFDARVDNYWKGKWIKHPAQINLHGLPAELNTKIVHEMVENLKKPVTGVSNYEEWLYASYGKTFSENFPMKYTRKFHTTEAANLSTDWLGPRLYKPDISEVIFGMLSPETKDVHYVKEFRYPIKNGFVSFMSGIYDVTKIHFNHNLVSINLKDKELKFSNNEIVNYKHCFSSLPVNRIIGLIKDAPEEVSAAAEKLDATQCILVNIGVNRNDLSPCHWRYVYDEEFISTRLSFPGMFNPGNVPEGQGSVQVEVYFSRKYKPLDRKPAEFIPIVKDELIRMGILNSDDEILFQNAWMSQHAQVIYDHDRKKNVELIHTFLTENDIQYGGRFADWTYTWSDEAFSRGEQAAETIIRKIR